MSQTGIVPYRSPAARNFGLGIEKNQKINDFQVQKRHQLPTIISTNLPPPTLPGIGGGIAYDSVTKRVYYSEGTTWLPVSAGSGTGEVASYSFVKNNALPVPSSVETPIDSWETSSDPSYSIIDTPDWNLTTGIYTAPEDINLVLSVGISWASGSNSGVRTTRLQLNRGGPWITVKEVETQADPNAAIETTQEFSFNLRLSSGEQVRVSVFQNSSIGLSLVDGDRTSISGLTVGI